MSTDREIQILVVGGGIAGLAVGTFLRSAGFDPVVVNRTAIPDRRGGVVELWPDAVEALSSIVATDTVRQSGTPVRSWSLVDDSGTVKQSLAAENSAHPGFIAIKYRRLCDLLANRLPNHKVRAKTTVRSVEERADGALVEFQNGVDEQFDVVIGADGARSTIRGEFGSGEQVSRMTTSYGFCANDTCTPNSAAEQWTSNGSVYRVLPTQNGAWIWLTLPTSIIPEDCSGQSVVAKRIEETEIVSNDDCPSDDDIVVRSDHRVGSSVLASDRIALVGAAAHTRHPLTGLGPCLALEDAAVLTAELTEQNTTIEAGLAEYASRRQSRPDPPTEMRGDSPLKVGNATGWVLGNVATIRGTRFEACFTDRRTTPAPEIDDSTLDDLNAR